MGEHWDVRRAGATNASHRVLMIPGGLCTTEFYADVMAEPAAAGLGMIAVTQPGFGRTEAPEDVSMEHYARLMADFAAESGCDSVVGHSLGANVAIEMAALGLFKGPLVLLSPTFSRGDEATFLTVLNTVGRVPGLGGAAWRAMLKLMPRAMKHELPPRRAELLAAVMGDNDPAACRRIVRDYYAYLDRYPSLVARLCAAGVPAWVVRGDRDMIGLTDGERRDLRACPQIRIVTVADAGHLLLVDQPAAVAEIVAEAATASVR
ncbi:Pimeloyl-ACP methyl ester carboxylesterase [Streptomyces sp. yr375]|uniref:alpha/beta fold hydrolase n=1 Tax=Streptomyces sp. yr375 TaxID=1761906 RepID=UPI0008D362FC|nr:alpha/beta hydrolase [Streptomyces sp. yr375]SEP60820.1 Pimeloyl-ACP methyl ester carboxylesterase [Streptomyces sp. yr375]